MSKIKKIVGVMLAAMMVMAMSVAVLADDTYTITINNDTSGYVYTAYQIFKGDLSTETVGSTTTLVLSNVDWGDDVNGSDLLTALKASTTVVDSTDNTTVGTMFTNCTTAADVAEVLSNNSTNDALTEAFATLAAANVTDTSTKTSGTHNGTSYAISNLTAGYYLVKTTTVPDNGTHTKYILKVVGDAEVDTKSDTVTIDKQVGDEVSSTDSTNDDSTEDYDVGDAVPFTLTATLPSNYADYSTYQLVFHDTLSDGLTFNSSSVTVKVDGDKITLASGAVVFSTDSITGKTTVTITIANLKTAYPSATKDSKVVVSYTATLNNKAESVEENDAYLTYSNNPNGDGTGKTTDDKTYVVTFTLVVNKTDGTDPLEGAGFTLYKFEGVGATGADAEGYVEIKVIAAGTDTTFSFSGLANGKYKLVETDTPAGYNTADDIIFTIDAVTVEGTNGAEVTSITIYDSDGTTVISSSDVTDNKTFLVSTSAKTLTTEIVNNAGSTLPSTGGIGTTIFYIVGGILVVGAAILLITRVRMRKVNE